MSRQALRNRLIPAAVLAGTAAVWFATLFVMARGAQAVPAFARRYGMTCSACHSAWPALSDDGWSFKMSGYRRLNGKDLEPTTKDIELAAGDFTIPSIPPFAIEAGAGFDYRGDKAKAMDGTTATRTGNSFNVGLAEFFAAAPLGKHLSGFFEFPLFETKSAASDGPTGPWAAQVTTGAEARRAIQFETESPSFEKGKLIWNSLLPESVAPPDSLNLVLGADQLPTAFSAEANRLSVNPYLIYRRRAVDLLSSVAPDDVLGGGADRLLRLGEPQIQVAMNGVLVPGGKLTDLAKPEMVSLEYHLGVTNGSNVNADPNRSKDFFGRLAMRWWGQRVGVFGYYSPDTYDDAIRQTGAGVGVFSGQPLSNRFSSVGPDLTLSLEPLDIPVWVETQILFNHESNPTGFDRSFKWWGGFSQANWKIVKSLIAYGRYDWLHGDRFDDTEAEVGGLMGVTGPVKPREWQAVIGLQWYVLENLKLTAEYSHRDFQNKLSTPSRQKVEENFFTVRATVGF